MILLCMIVLVSCNESTPEQNFSVADSTQLYGKLDSILHWPYQLDHIGKTEMSELDTAHQHTSQYSYYIDNDTIVLSQFVHYYSYYFWSGEEMYYLLQLRIPLECASRGYTMEIGPPDELYMCKFRSSMWHSAFGGDIAQSITGTISLLALDDSSMIFRQNIRVIATDSSVFPNVYRYCGMETALYWRDAISEHPPIPYLRRRVVR